MMMMMMGNHLKNTIFTVQTRLASFWAASKKHDEQASKDQKSNVASRS